ncbi:MAG TPA: hypothetical protein K8V91_11105 [[Clostridium] spiroforme]|uniref:Uncharacterized protein n=1 Tax=Thomasclavelia spiroformis TaxID=29348 RepID=A0A921GC29_9FIRM|nr:hypothetical protein [Thomasclavelia spiroformis]
MKIVIEDKFLKIIDKEILRSGNVNSYKMSIEYDSFYNDRVLMIYFKQDDIKKIVTVGPDNIIDIPHEVLENERDVYVGFYSPSPDGDRLKDRYCSNFDRLIVIEGAYDKDATPSEELTPTILEKYLQEMKNFYNESLEKYNNNANEKTEAFDENYKNKKSEIDKVAEVVSKDKSDIEEMKKAVETSEANAKTSEENAKKSEENAEKSYQASVDIATGLSLLAFYVDEDLKLHVVSESELINQKFNLNKNKLEVIYFANR